MAGSKKRVFGDYRDAAPVGARLAMKRLSQRHLSWETAIERTSETARQRQRQALRNPKRVPCGLRKSIDNRGGDVTVEQVCWLACGNLEHAAEDRGTVLLPLGSFRCRPVSTRPFIPVSNRLRTGPAPKHCGVSVFLACRVSRNSLKNPKNKSSREFSRRTTEAHGELKGPVLFSSRLP